MYQSDIFGRLIRSKTDTRIVVILDARNRSGSIMITRTPTKQSNEIMKGTRNTTSLLPFNRPNKKPRTRLPVLSSVDEWIIITIGRTAA